jgi:sodium/hydrogen exchanger-like protein 6/7
LEEKATFNPEIFFYILLPPIIFHEGYSMRKKAFFDNLGAILAFALFGTLISTIVIALVVYGFAQFISASISFKFVDFVYFGAIISATDPVTVLSIFQVRREN